MANNCIHKINLNNPFRVFIELRQSNTVDGIRLVFFTDDNETPMDFTGWAFATSFFDIEVELPNVLILSATAEKMNIALGDYNLDIKGTLNSKEQTIVAGRYEVKKDYLTSGCVQDGSEVNLQYFNVIERIVIEGGWLPYFAMPSYQTGYVLQLVGWFGGEGDLPTQYIDWYVGELGYVEDIENAILFGLKGDKGDAFTFDDFTSEQILLLQQPAIDAAVYANEQGNITKQIGIDTEQVRLDTIQAKEDAEAATIVANNARGWTPLYTEELYDGKLIWMLSDYTGGNGVKPTTNVGKYLKDDGTYTTDKDEASNHKGEKGDSVDLITFDLVDTDLIAHIPDATENIDFSISGEGNLILTIN